MTLTAMFIGVAVFMQGVENFALSSSAGKRNFLLKIAAAAQVLGAAAGFWDVRFRVAGAILMLIGTWVTAAAWRGTLNGGSDFMTFHILAAWLGYLLKPDWITFCLTYIAIQLILSYFVAGVAKAARREWWTGEALQSFFQRYGVRLRFVRELSWILILFELSWPLAWYWPALFVWAGIVFHLLNAYLFGLNRFFWAWLAAYPALLVVAG